MVITKKYFTDFEEPGLQLSVTKSKESNYITFTCLYKDSVESEMELSKDDVKELINELNNLISNG
jgi:uncharacterized protein YfeS